MQKCSALKIWVLHSLSKELHDSHVHIKKKPDKLFGAQTWSFVLP